MKTVKTNNILSLLLAISCFHSQSATAAYIASISSHDGIGKSSPWFFCKRLQSPTVAGAAPIAPLSPLFVSSSSDSDITEGNSNNQKGQEEEQDQQREEVVVTQETEEQEEIPSQKENVTSTVDTLVSAVETTAVNPNQRRRIELKHALLQYGASFDRGFGTSPSARKQVESLITELETLNEAVNVSIGIDGVYEPKYGRRNTHDDDDDDDEGSFVSVSNTPLSSSEALEGNWRMVWTTAQDVLVLNASPLVTVGAIYQVFTPPVITNIIDFVPRPQALLPPSMSLSFFSMLRAKVKTRASPRTGRSMRIGLDFETVQLQPVQLLGQSVMDTLPPVTVNLPNQISNAILNAFTGSSDPKDTNRPGYFDVTFLDDELLVIRQNQPGGIFVLVKTPNNDP